MSFTSSDTGICNMALGHIGTGKVIANLTSESSREAVACRTFYETARDEVLRDFAWPFATKIEALAEVEEDPNEEWAFSYREPSDCLMFRKIQSGIRNDNRQSRVPFRKGGDSAGGLIFTDKEDAIGEYTRRVTQVEFYPPDFKTLLAYKLAGYIVPLLSAGDPSKIRDSMAALYQMKRGEVMAAARNEEQPEEPPESEFVRGREGEVNRFNAGAWQELPPESE